MSVFEFVKESEFRQDEIYDVVICGGGISGLYSAWRLMTSSYFKEKKLGHKPKVCIVELSTRVGGRIETAYLKGAEKIPAELGAMRYLDDHKIISLMVKNFKLKTKRFKSHNDRLYFLRGKYLREKDFKDYKKVPYNLRVDERGKSPDQLLVYAIDKLYPDFSKKILNKFQNNKNLKIFNGKNIKDVEMFNLGFKNGLLEVLSHEAYALLRDGNGYESNSINWSTSEAIPYLLENFTQKSEARSIEGGMSKLVEALSVELRALGVTFLMDTKLVSFENVLSDSGNEILNCYIQKLDNSKTATLRTDKLILALPQRSLELLDQNNKFFQDKRVQYCLRSVMREPAFKLFMSYENPWWRNSKIKASPIISDLPIRMTYYYSDFKKGPKDFASGSLFMAYQDMDPDFYWLGLHKDPKTPSVVGNSQKAPKRMVQAAHTGLCEIFKLNEIPDPMDTLFRDWRSDPFGGGYHAWLPCYESWKVMDIVRNPIPEMPVYICGEAYSNMQSWMEGAVKTAESVLQEFFNIEPLAGLPLDYNLIDRVEGDKGLLLAA